MKTKKWKIAFWISAFFFLISNVYWIYNTIDIAVGHGYYKVQCESYYKDRIEFEKVLSAFKTKDSMLIFFKDNNIEYDSFPKGDDFIIQLNSIGFIFDKNGKLIETENF